MGNISVRNVPKDVIFKIDEMAAKKKMSREAFLRNHFKQIAVSGEVKSAENKYESLVRLMLDRLEENNMMMEQTMQLMEQMEEYVKKMGKEHE